MNESILDELSQKGFIREDNVLKIKDFQRHQLVSLHWELKTILYAGVILLSGGLGILIYKNLDQIGHWVIVTAITILCTACFGYCFKKKAAFSLTAKVLAPDIFFDYILVLGCLLFIIQIGYLQYQYQLFGVNRYSLAVFIPMLVLFYSAYYFDHLGVLCMAITNLATWVGVTISPLQVLKENLFTDSVIIYTALALGIFLELVSVLSERKSIKKHFAFTYSNFALHLLFVASISAMVHSDKLYYLYFLLIPVVAGYYYYKAVTIQSFYFLLVLTLYTYAGLTYLVSKLILDIARDMGSVYFMFFYLIGSAVLLLLFLIRMNKKFKS
jgi:hypothetical protein